MSVQRKDMYFLPSVSARSVLCCACAAVSWAGASVALGVGYEVPNPAWNAPASYYNAATGTGFTLRTNLHNVITAGFTARSYGDSRYAMGTGDTGISGGTEFIDPANSANILLVYNDASIAGQWDAGVTWNREHVWPKSLLNLTSSQVDNTYVGVASDAFELMPANPGINSSRSNNGYGFYPYIG